jgi:hypothetical protein
MGNRLLAASSTFNKLKFNGQIKKSQVASSQGEQIIQQIIRFLYKEANIGDLAACSIPQC